MTFSRLASTFSVVAVGVALGFLAAFNESHTTARADGTRTASGNSTTTISPAPTAQASCSDSIVDRKLALAEAVAEANAATLVQVEKATQAGKKPNIVIIWGDDVGQSNISAYTHGLMGYQTPNIDRVAREGMIFTDYYAEQSCTAGRASFITGQHGMRTGMTKVGLPAATLGLRKEDPTIAELLKPLGYATAQIGKNHLGDRNEFLPTVHGFDEFYGNLYHLNAEEEPELPDYPKDPAFRSKCGDGGRNRSHPISSE